MGRGFRMKFSRQTTLRSQATVTGVGVHSGSPVSLTLGPASVDAGFIFVRTGLDAHGRPAPVAAAPQGDDHLDIPAFLRRQAN